MEKFVSKVSLLPDDDKSFVKSLEEDWDYMSKATGLIGAFKANKCLLKTNDELKATVRNFYFHVGNIVKDKLKSQDNGFSFYPVDKLLKQWCYLDFKDTLEEEYFNQFNFMDLKYSKKQLHQEITNFLISKGLIERKI